jgi:hypothetical protein
LSEYNKASKTESPKPNKIPQAQKSKTLEKHGAVMMARKGDLKNLREPNAMCLCARVEGQSFVN